MIYQLQLADALRAIARRPGTVYGDDTKVLFDAADEIERLVKDAGMFAELASD